MSKERVQLPTWFLVTVFATVRTFYLAMLEAFIVWGFTALFLPTPVTYIKAFVVLAVPAFILSLYRVSGWFKED